MKIKKWSAKARKWAKEFGTCRPGMVIGGQTIYRGIACVLDCSRQHASAMIRGVAATTPANAEKLRREARSQGYDVTVEDFGQRTTAKKGGK